MLKKKKEEVLKEEASKSKSVSDPYEQVNDDFKKQNLNSNANALDHDDDDDDVVFK
jgi:hypothetical protein